jgi:hypothetical protein
MNNGKMKSIVKKAGVGAMGGMAGEASKGMGDTKKKMAMGAAKGVGDTKKKMAMGAAKGVGDAKKKMAMGAAKGMGDAKFMGGGMVKGGYK